jgi:hypothetical protein
VVHLIHQSLAGIAVRDIVWGFVVSAYFRFHGGIGSHPETAIGAFVYRECFAAGIMILTFHQLLEMLTAADGTLRYVESIHLRFFFPLTLARCAFDEKTGPSHIGIVHTTPNFLQKYNKNVSSALSLTGFNSKT